MFAAAAFMFIVMGRRLCARDGEMVRVDTPNTLAPVRVATKLYRDGRLITIACGRFTA